MKALPLVAFLCSELCIVFLSILPPNCPVTAGLNVTDSLWNYGAKADMLREHPLVAQVLQVRALLCSNVIPCPTPPYTPPHSTPHPTLLQVSLFNSTQLSILHAYLL